MFYRQLANSGTTTGKSGELRESSRSPGLENQSKRPEHFAFLKRILQQRNERNEHNNQASNLFDALPE
jgi:hypothetical protein